MVCCVYFMVDESNWNLLLDVYNSGCWWPELEMLFNGQWNAKTFHWYKWLSAEEKNDSFFCFCFWGCIAVLCWIELNYIEDKDISVFLVCSCVCVYCIFTSKSDAWCEFDKWFSLVFLFSCKKEKCGWSSSVWAGDKLNKVCLLKV